MAERDLFHGGALNRHFIHGKDALISSRHPESPSLNAALTDSLEYARKYAFTRTVEWGTPPYVALYRIPEHLLVYEGEVSGHVGVGGWSTNEFLTKDELPRSFYFAHGYSARQIAEMVLEGLQFYSVPPENFIRFVDIDVPRELAQFIKNPYG